MQYRIGEFSRITGLTIKALRHYHEEALLGPNWIDEESGYRYYGEEKIQDALLIVRLREMGFSLQEIREVLRESKKEGNMAGLSSLFANRLEEVRSNLRREKERERAIRKILSEELALQEKKSMEPSATIEQTIGPWIILSHRFRGKYSDVGKHFGRLYRLAGRHGKGVSGSFYYDGEFKEGDADIECFILLKKNIKSPDPDYAAVRQISEQKVLSIVHIGPYDSIGTSYEKIFKELNRRKLTAQIPSGELYEKGPGFLLKGNPERYRTRIFFSLNQAKSV